MRFESIRGKCRGPHRAAANQANFEVAFFPPISLLKTSGLQAVSFKTKNPTLKHRDNALEAAARSCTGASLTSKCIRIWRCREALGLGEAAEALNPAKERASEERGGCLFQPAPDTGRAGEVALRTLWRDTNLSGVIAAEAEGARRPTEFAAALELGGAGLIGSVFSLSLSSLSLFFSVGLSFFKLYRHKLNCLLHLRPSLPSR